MMQVTEAKCHLKYTNSVTWSIPTVSPEVYQQCHLKYTNSVTWSIPTVSPEVYQQWVNSFPFKKNTTTTQQ